VVDFQVQDTLEMSDSYSVRGAVKPDPHDRWKVPTHQLATVQYRPPNLTNRRVFFDGTDDLLLYTRTSDRLLLPPGVNVSNRVMWQALSRTTKWYARRDPRLVRPAVEPTTMEAVLRNLLSVVLSSVEGGLFLAEGASFKYPQATTWSIYCP
jgi:hypothetical protein